MRIRNKGRIDEMKKLRSIVSAGLVLAIAMSVASCDGEGKNTTEDTTYEAPTTVTEIEEPTTTETESTTKPTVDPWGQLHEADEIVGATAIADKLIDQKTDDALFGHDLDGFMHGGAAFSGDKSHRIMMPDGGYKIEGYEFKRIYLWTENDIVTKITFAVRDKELIPSTEAETKGAASDMNYDAEGAYAKITSELNAAFGESTKLIDTAELKAAKSECLVWEHNGRDIAVTYAVDCYGIAGNNEFRIDVYTSGAEGSSDASADDFKVTMTKLGNCMGLDKDSVKTMVEDLFGVKLDNEQADKNNYYYSASITIEGVEFNQVIIKTNKGDGKTYEIYFVNDTSNTKDCEGYLETFKKKLAESFSDNFIPTNSAEYKGVMHMISDYNFCIIGGSYSANYNRFYLIINAERLKEK